VFLGEVAAHGLRWQELEALATALLDNSPPFPLPLDTETATDAEHPLLAPVMSAVASLTEKWTQVHTDALTHEQDLAVCFAPGIFCFIFYTTSGLQSSLLAHEWLAAAGDATAWLREKTELLALAGNHGVLTEDEALAMVTKHDAVNNEIAAYAGLLANLQRNGTALLNAHNSAADTIVDHLELLAGLYEALVAAGEARKDRLADAVVWGHFVRETDTVRAWLSGALQHAQSVNTGAELPDTLSLLKAHAECEAGLALQQTQLVALTQQAHANDSADAPAMINNAAALEALAAELDQALAAQGHRLTAARQLHEFCEDAAELGEWVADKLAAASSKESIADLQAAQVNNGRIA
jgi:hypothetical protein